MDFKNNSKKMKVNSHLNNQKELELEKEKTRQLELIKQIKKLELKLKNNKKYKHTKKYVDLSAILNDDNDSIDYNDIEYDNEQFDTISIQSTKSITTIDYVDLLS